MTPSGSRKRSRNCASGSVLSSRIASSRVTAIRPLFRGLAQRRRMSCSPPGMGSAMPASSTLVAGRYRLGAELGSGGMGVVWEAYDELLHRTVAIKEIRYPIGISDDDREKLARRTLREARAVAAVEDPHAVRVFDIVEQDGRPWLVMELVRGRTLTEMLREDGPLPVAEVVQIGLALTEALSAAHRAGVLHRDVKPSN